MKNVSNIVKPLLKIRKQLEKVVTKRNAKIAKKQKEIKELTSEVDAAEEWLTVIPLAKTKGDTNEV